MVIVDKERIKRVEKQIYEIRRKIADIHGSKSIEERNLVSVEGRDLDDLYFTTVMKELQHGELNPVEEGSHAGEIRLEFPGFSCCVKYPTKEPFAPQTREGIPVATDNNAILNYFHDYLLNGALNPNEHYRYASWITGISENYSKGKLEELKINIDKARLLKDLGFDITQIPLEHRRIPRGTRFNQLEWCAQHFGEKGYGTNHCAITVGCPEGLQRYNWKYDVEKSETERGSSECLRQITLKIRKGNQLDLSTFWRSWDLYEGLPENLGGFAHFMNYTAELINANKKDSQPEVVPGRMYAYSDGLHIYDHSLDLAKIWTNIK